jgi:hypothetical protein
MTKIARFIIWICSKFTKGEIEQIIKGLVDVLQDRNPEVKPKDDFKEQHPHYRNFFVDSKPPLTEPPVLKKAPEPKDYISLYNPGLVWHDDSKRNIINETILFLYFRDVIDTSSGVLNEFNKHL